MTQIIDLSYQIHNDMFKYPSDPAPEILRTQAELESQTEEIFDESGFSSGCGAITEKYKSGYTELKIRNHHGTHVDAPAHKLPDGKTIDSYFIGKFINKARLVDLTITDLMGRKKREIKRSDIERYLEYADFKTLKEYVGKDTTALVFYTGFCDEIAENNNNLNGEAKQNFEKTFPYFSLKAINYLIEQSPKLNILGMDSFSLDRKGSNSEAHRAILEKGILPLETLVNLKELRDKTSYLTFLLHCVPVPYIDGDAAQTRAYAIVG